VSLQDGEGSFCDPFLGVAVTLVKEAPGCVPEVLQDVYEIDDQRNILPKTAALGLRAHAGDLVTIPVHQDHPAPSMLRVAPASSNTLLVTACAVFSTLAHTRLLRARGRGFEMSRTGRSSPRTSSGRRAWGVRS